MTSKKRKCLRSNIFRGAESLERVKEMNGLEAAKNDSHL